MTLFLNRKYTLNNGRDVIVNINYPVQDGMNFCCFISIAGLEGPVLSLKSIGIDTIQCVYEGLRMAGTILIESDEFRRGELQWEAGMGDDDLGLPNY